ncbi:MAG: restriction endonuclease subunit S [Desulfobacteraceae bacterium]|nr:restriction endonuclease subunit S [Desulfobacteraceae bacterium]
MKYGLSDEQLKQVLDIIASYDEIEEAILFGSRAIDTYKEASDVDIALKGTKVTASLAAKLKFHFEEDTYLPFFFDFIAYPTITNEALKEHIDTKGVVIYRRGWRECILEDVIENFIDYRGKTPQKTECGIPLITANIVKAGRILEPNEFIAADDYRSWMTRGLPEINDVVLTTEAPLGEVALIKDKNVALAQRIITLRGNKNFVHNPFLKYYFQSATGQYELDCRASGTTVFGIKAAVLKKMPVLLPPLPEQKAIASVLSSLDDKIDLLHRQNKTLEAMAETLFRQWFVEEAKDDWEEKSLLEVIQLIGGGTPKTAIDEYWDGDIPWLAGGDIASNHKSFVNHSAKSITELGLNNSSAKLLPQYATVISARGTVGKYCILAKQMAFSQSNYGILPNISEYFFFTYLIVNHVVEELQSSAYGSVFDTITTNTFKEINISLPKEIEIHQFEQAVSTYFDKIFLNTVQILTLKNLRDTLLPKLMSGEVRVEYKN